MGGLKLLPIPVISNDIWTLTWKGKKKEKAKKGTSPAETSIDGPGSVRRLAWPSDR